MGIKRLFFIFVLLTGAVLADAQELTVEDMKLEGMDISASTNRRLDAKGSPCALIKVQLASENVQFEGNVVQPVEFNKGEYWVYMPKGSNQLTIKHPDYAPLTVNFLDYAIDKVQPLTTYLLIVNVPFSNKVADDGVRNFVLKVDNLKFQKDAKVFIDDQELQVGRDEFIIPLDKGRHTYRIECPTYVTEIDTFEIDKNDVRRTITLKKIKVNVTFTCPTPGANISVNYNQSGNSPLNTDIEVGDYKVSARLDGYRSTSKRVYLTEDHNNQTITLPALTPIEGSLHVNYTPAGAEVYVDGKLLGNTPCQLQHLLIGDHTIEVKKQGYLTEKEEIKISEGITSNLNGVMQDTSSENMSLSDMVKLGQDYWKGTNGKEANRIEAAKLFHKAAKLGNARAQNYLGEMLENELGINRNWEEVVGWYRKAAEQGNADAQFHLGECYELGPFRGLKTDVNQAAYWYEKAAAQKHAAAIERLEIVKRKYNLIRKNNNNKNSNAIMMNRMQK